MRHMHGARHRGGPNLRKKESIHNVITYQGRILIVQISIPTTARKRRQRVESSPKHPKEHHQLLKVTVPPMTKSQARRKKTDDPPALSPSTEWRM